MAALACEICGGKLMAKAGGLFECEYCGMQYDKTRIQEMVQEIKGTVKVEGTVEVTGTVKVAGSASAESLLKRGMLALEDSEWKTADEYFNKVLDINPESAEAYLGKLMVELKVTKQDALRNCSKSFDDAPMFRKVLKYADKPLTEQMQDYVYSTKLSIAVRIMDYATTVYDYALARNKLEEIIEYAPAAKALQRCDEAIRSFEKCVQDAKDAEKEIERASFNRDKIIEEAKKRSAEYNEQLHQKIASLKENERKKLSERIAVLNGDIEKHKQQFATLSFFKIAERKKLKSDIAKLQHSVISLQEETALVEQAKKWEETRKKALEEYVAKVDAYVAKRFIRTTANLKQFAEVTPRKDEKVPFDTVYLDTVLREGNVPRSYGEWMEITGETSSQRLTAIFNRLLGYGLIGYMYIDGKKYICRPDCVYTVTVEAWEEVQEVAKQSMPQAPCVDLIFK